MIGPSQKFMSHLFKDGRAMFLAYDQGLEHGPKDFNDKNYNPEYIIDIALRNKYTGLIFHKGLAEKYHENYSGKVPLIVKVNGKDNIAKAQANEEPYSPIVCSVDHAVELGADAIGYTLYVGSPLEAQAMEDFQMIQESARDYGLPVVGWMYPRGKYVPNDVDPNIVAYGARVGLELGCDLLKVKYTGSKETFKNVVDISGRAKILCAGGLKSDLNVFLKQTRDILDVGAAGVAVGRNVWQSDNPDRVSKALEKIIFENKSVEDALK